VSNCWTAAARIKLLLNDLMDGKRRFFFLCRRPRDMGLAGKPAAEYRGDIYVRHQISINMYLYPVILFPLPLSLSVLILFFV
jgi:hypothetical protein